ncbi:MAG TPA: NAD(P)(+) transhydrogenase (Re/Si-specific) subunit beta [Kofleriaceae bacterium]|nr:NAD(P)(+) transhydrogenase (Re/Si-specific) subunit beta [Kofleriaceae bacterium]
MTTTDIVQLLYLAASALFILGLQSLGKADTARRGVLLAEVGMALAVAGTLLHHEIVTYHWIVVSVVIGSAIGTAMGLFIPMVKMPERIALSHAFGGLAVALVGIAEYHRHGSHLGATTLTAVGLEVFLGALTFTGSLLAFGKLQGVVRGAPVVWRGQNVMNLLGVAAALAGVVFLVAAPSTPYLLFGILAVGLVLGVTLVVPVGGADMPVVICLLNAYAGLAAAATGFALGNNVLIICGALDGGSGLILGLMMSKAMNRSFTNVLFGASDAGGVPASATASAGGGGGGGSATVSTVEDAAAILEAARSVIIVPGYGMAVSQAQHAVRDLANALTAAGVDVKYAIHPVAGRMPGHMNVLLAEANVPYEQLFDLDSINDDFGNTDVAIVVGANDVVNPAAKTQKSSPIYGMPVLAVDKARTAICFKRSFKPGFAGVENELFTRPSTMMVLGDAKDSVAALVRAVREASGGGHGHGRMAA